MARTLKPPINYTTGLAGNVKTLYLDLFGLLSLFPLAGCRVRRRSWKKESKKDRQKEKKVGGKNHTHRRTSGCLVWAREPEQSPVALPSTVAFAAFIWPVLASISASKSDSDADSLRPRVALQRLQQAAVADPRSAPARSLPKTTGAPLIPYGSVLMPRPFQYRRLTGGNASASRVNGCIGNGSAAAYCR